MPRNTEKLARLSQRDQVVLNDLLRFGALTFEQIARRYDLRGHRQLPPLERLKDLGYLKKQPDWFSNTQFYAATDRARRVLRSRLEVVIPKPNSLPHDLTVVNLADWLLEQYPGSTWESERELMCGPRQPNQWGRAERDPHRPDGVLVTNGLRTGIELELDWKNYEKYARICRWFAARVEFAALRWFVQGDLLLDRIPRIVEAHALGPDLDIYVDPIPVEVEVLAWPR